MSGCELEPTEEPGIHSEALLDNCKTADDCHDNNPCTGDVCLLGQCVNAPVLGCNPGTGGATGSGGVLNLGGVLNVGGVLNLGGVLNVGGTLNEGGEPGTVITIACSKDHDCDDDDPCTANLCAINICATLPVIGCEAGAGGEPGAELGCTTDQACEDGHPCTNNTCVAGLCVALPVLGCCFQGNCVIGVGGTTQVEIGGTGNGGGVSNGGNGGVSNGGNGGASNGGKAGASNGGKGGASNGGNGATSGSDMQSGGADPGGAASSGSDAGGTASGGTESGGGEPSSGATSGDGSGASAAGPSGGTKSDPKDPPDGDDTEWRMKGGGCSVAAPTGTSGASILSLLVLAAMATRRRRRVGVALAAAPLALVAGSAHAAGFAQDAYTSPAAPDDLMWTERAGSNAGHLRPFGRLTLGFADDPLVLVDANDASREQRVVDDQFAAYGALGIGLFERAHLAVLMPLYVQSSALAGGGTGVKGTQAGDLGFDGRFTILDRTAPLELALAATLRVPTGDRDSFASDGSVSVWPRALASKQLGEGGSLVNLSVGPMFRPKNEEGGVTTGTQLRYTAGALIALTRIIGVTGELVGSTVTSDPRKRNSPLEGAVGGRLTFSSVVLGTTLSTGLTEGIGSPDWRWLAMIALPGAVAEARPAEPPAPSNPDPDRDGVSGADDRCPNEMEDRDGFQDEDGCPEADNDGDGVADGADKCPTEPEDKDGFQDGDGCPEADNDGDGVADAADKCPTEPETKNGIDDEDGCPDLLRVEQGQIRTLEPIYFDTGKATIQARSEPLLLEMANLIRTRADLGTIAIEGHTDNKGNPKSNLKLSKDRSSAVRTFLVNAGVPEGRLSSEGFGSERPLEDNKSDVGRAKNRRVEFHFAPPSSVGAR